MRRHRAHYDVTVMSRGYFSPNNSGMTPIARPLGRDMGVFREFEVSLLSKLLCCVQCSVVLHRVICRVHSITIKHDLVDGLLI